MRRDFSSDVRFLSRCLQTDLFLAERTAGNVLTQIVKCQMSITVKNTAVDKIVFFFQNSASVRPQKVLEHGVMDVHGTRGLMDPLWRGHGHTGAGFGLFIRLANRKKDIFFSRLYPVDLQTWTHDYDFSVIYADLILNWQMYLNAMRDFTACGGTRCARVKINAHMPLPSVCLQDALSSLHRQLVFVCYTMHDTYLH